MTRHEYLKAKEEAIYYFGLCIDALVLPMVDEYENEVEEVEEADISGRTDEPQSDSEPGSMKRHDDDSEYDGYERRDGPNEYDEEIAALASEYRHKKHWTEDEYISVIRMIVDGRTVDEMATVLQRTPKAVALYLWRQGYGVRNGKPYPMPDIE